MPVDGAGGGDLNKLQLRVLSESTKYEAWTIKSSMDFEVYGRVLKAWHGDNL